MPTKKLNSSALYFPQKLQRRLEDIPEYPLTVIHAPSGFGKTTAVTEYLKNRNASVFWLTAEADNNHFWVKLCDLVGILDKEAGEMLRMLGHLTEANYQTVSGILRAAATKGETIFVLDDYHLAESALLTQLITELFCTKGTYRHLVVLTQSFGCNTIYNLVLHKRLNYLTKEDLSFGKSDVTAYYRLCGITLNDQEQNDIFRYTEGWIAALYLQLLGYLQQERFEPQVHIEKLVESSVVNKLSPLNRQLLYYLCSFEGFTLEQAMFMAQGSPFEDTVSATLETCALIRYDAGQRRYYMHEILRQFLMVNLERQPLELQHTILHRTALWYIQQKEYLTAMRLFYELRQFDVILSLPMVALDIVRVLNKENRKLFLDIYYNCPPEIKQEYPRGLVLLSFSLFIYQEKQAFLAAVNEFYRVINRSTLSVAEKNRLKGEMAFILSLAQYNDISRMSKLHRHAYGLIRGPITIVSTRGPWTFGSPSVLYMFHRESGRLNDEQRCMDECLPYYYKLATGHGSGAEEVMRAEILFNRGDFDGTRVACYQAAYMAKEKGQNCISLCVLLLLARLAIALGDTVSFREQTGYIKELIPTALCEGLSATVDLCEGYLLTLLGKTEHIAAWLKNGEINDNHLQFMVVPYANILYARILLLAGEYQRVIGLSKPFLSLGCVFPNLMAQIYTHLYTAAAYYKLGNTPEAKGALSTALNLAMPDAIYMPFVENGDYITSLLQSLQRDGLYKQEIDTILRLSAAYRAGVEKINADFTPKSDLGLTGRELEVTLLAAKRLSNKEIAAQLYISENTVKFNLKAVYQKLCIQSRRELAGILSDNGHH